MRIYTVQIYLNVRGLEVSEVRELWFDEESASARVDELNGNASSCRYVLGTMHTRDEPPEPEPAPAFAYNPMTIVYGRGNNDGTRTARLVRTTQTLLVVEFKGVEKPYCFRRSNGVGSDWINGLTPHAMWIPKSELDRLNREFPGVNKIE